MVPPVSSGRHPNHHSQNMSIVSKEHLESPAPKGVQSVDRAMAILLAVATSEYGLTARELMDRLGLQRQTAYLLLRSLVGNAFLVRGADGRHRLGLRVGTLAEAFARQPPSGESLAPYVRRLSERTGESSYLCIRRDVRVVLLVYAASERHELRVGLTTPGPLDHIHARASGRVALAWAPPEIREQFFASGRLQRLTSKTTTNRAALEAEFAAIRERGFAVCRGELEEGVATLAAPIDAGVSPFVMSIAAPIQRFDANLDEYREALLHACAISSSQTE